MNRYDSQTLYDLLPAIYRQRDAELGYPLRDLVEVIGEQSQVLEADIEQLYRNWFIETCDAWVVPYIGDLIGVRPASSQQLNTRAEITNTLGYRKRKGTLAVVEQLARDVTGWPARAVEYFTLLSTTQNINHLHLDNHGTPNLRDSATLAQLGGPFENTAHLLDVRSIVDNAGRYNIPNIGVHLWRLSSYELRRTMGHEVDDGTGLHYSFSSLGNNIPLFRRPQGIEKPFDSSTENHMPDPIQYQVLDERLNELYGEHSTSSIAVWDGDVFIEPEQVAVCNLADWQHEVPLDKTIAIDPELGRVAFREQPSSIVRVLYHYGFSAHIGSGSYNRSGTLDRSGQQLLHVGTDSTQEPIEGVERFATIAEALVEWSSLPVADRPTIIEIDDNGTYNEDLSSIEIPERASLTIRAANRRRPTLLLTNELHIIGAEDSEFELNGLLVANQGMRVSGQLKTLRINHSTLVPGRLLSESGQPLQVGEASIRIEASTSTLEIKNSIIGPIHTAIDVLVSVCDTIIDANDVANFAYQGLQDGESGGAADILRSTIIGSILATEISLASDTIFLGMIETIRQQQGCLRFSHVPLHSVVARRFHCQPAESGGMSSEELDRLALAVMPRFTSLSYSTPGYCQIAQNAPIQIRRGAESESEMGVFSSLQQAQREDSLHIRLDEYLRLGMEAGVFYVT